MKAASSSEIKQRLKETAPAQLMELCLRLARFKKENKELLTFLLFEADDMETYLRQVKEEISEGFAAINSSNLYLAKKSLRKLLRQTNKYIRYTGSKEAEVELLMHYCTEMKESGIRFRGSTALAKLYAGQLKKIRTSLEGFHEDLQYEYEKELKKLETDK